MVLCWQSSHTPPLVFPVVMYTAMSKWHWLEWPLQLHSVTKTESKIRVWSQGRCKSAKKTHQSQPKNRQDFIYCHKFPSSSTSCSYQTPDLCFTQTHFCMHYYCGLQRVARVSHGRNPNTVHSLTLWYYVCTCSAHGPVIQKQKQKQQQKTKNKNKKEKHS